jgi:hypothetical protein
LVRALERWDAEAADAAIVGLVRGAQLDDVFELAWEYGARCQANIGHKAIYSAMAHRCLALTGPRFAEDALRSLVASYFIDGKTERAEPFEASRVLVEKGLKLRANDEFDAGAAKELDDDLARATPSAAPLVIARALESKVSASSAWDAIVASNARLVVASPSIGALHALTSSNALHYVHRHARTERVRLLTLLQASAWSCFFRESSADDSKAATSAPAAPNDSIDAALALVRAKSDDVHDFKVAAAAAEEAHLAASHAKPLVLAALAVHVPPRDRPTTTTRARIREAVG